MKPRRGFAGDGCDLRERKILKMFPIATVAHAPAETKGR